MKLKPNMIYMYEMETADGTVMKQFAEDGKEYSWKTSIKDPEQIVRVTFVPRLPILPKHDILIDISNGERFVKRFGRGFLKQKIGFNLAEYLNCVETNKYRFWLFSNGSTLITRNDYEVYI